MGSRTNPWGTPDETFKQKRPIEGLLMIHVLSVLCFLFKGNTKYN